MSMRFWPLHRPDAGPVDVTRSDPSPTYPAVALGPVFWNKSLCSNTNPMNWLFLNPIKAQGWGGMENWMLKLCLGLRDHGDRCLMVGRPSSPWQEVCRQNGVPFEPFRFGVDLAPWAVIRLRRIAAAFSPDIVMAKGFRQVRFARCACPGVTIATKMPAPNELKDEWLDRLTVNRWIDRILIDNHSVRHWFLRQPWLLPGKVVAIHNGVAIPNAADRPGVRERLCHDLGLPPDAVLVGAAGRLSPEKRYGDALHAFAQAAQGPTTARLVLFGEGPDRDALEALAATLGLNDRVVFPGWRDEVRQWLPAFDIVVHPSSIEGLPNTVLEAMAGGAAVIASDAGGTREIFTVPDIGRLYQPGDVSTLTAHLRDLLGDSAARKTLGRNAIAHVTAHFAIPVMVDAIRATLQSARTARMALQAHPRRTSAAAPLTVQRTDAIPIDLFAAMSAPDAQRVSQSPRATVVRIAHKDRPFYLKEFHYPARLAWRYAWRTPEALANFHTAQRLELAGVAVVPHLAAASQSASLSGTSILQTGVIADAQSLSWLLNDPAAFARFQRYGTPAFAVWLGHLHSAGIAPHDLKISNILVRGLDTATPEFVLLDLDNAHICHWGGVSAREAERNLHQCFRSFQPLLTQRFVLRFVARYRTVRRIERAAFRTMLAVVEKRLHRRGTGFAELS